MNCIVIDDDVISRRLIHNFVDQVSLLQLVGSFSNALEAISFLATNSHVDLVFLDIEMPHMNGLEFLQSLNSKPQIIVISSKKEYAFDAFGFDVTDYVLKPIATARLFKAVNKAIELTNKTANEEPQDGVFVKKDTALVKVQFDEVLWIEALENYVVVNTLHERFTILMTMKSLMSKLPASRFLRVHRSFIVQLTKIKIIENNAIIFKLERETKHIPVARSFRSSLMASINLAAK